MLRALFLLLIVISFLSSSCTKECVASLPPDLVPAIDISGEWEVGGSGMFEARVISQNPPGNTACETLNPGTFSNSTKVLFFLTANDPAISVLDNTTVIENMLLGQIRRTPLRIENLNEGIYMIQHEVDFKNETLESDENNNISIEESTVSLIGLDGIRPSRSFLSQMSKASNVIYVGSPSKSN